MTEDGSILTAAARSAGPETRTLRPEPFQGSVAGAADLATMPQASDAPLDETRLVVDIAGFEGPLDLLLELAKRQKVDLRQISVAELADHYLALVASARQLRLELAADWLVMAAWLAWLKSRLLLPAPPEDADEQDPEELARDLAERLARLEAMRKAAGALLAQNRLGLTRFARGAPEVVATVRQVAWKAELFDLLSAYVRVRSRDALQPYAAQRSDVYSLDAALERLISLLACAVDWTELATFLPEAWKNPAERRRSGLASTFFAALELARRGSAELRQDFPFGPVRLRAAKKTDEP